MSSAEAVISLGPMRNILISLLIIKKLTVKLYLTVLYLLLT